VHGLLICKTLQTVFGELLEVLYLHIVGGTGIAPLNQKNEGSGFMTFLSQINVTYFGIYKVSILLWFL
jgi:hypothetical protein